MLESLIELLKQSLIGIAAGAALAQPASDVGVGGGVVVGDDEGAHGSRLGRRRSAPARGQSSAAGAPTRASSHSSSMAPRNLSSQSSSGWRRAWAQSSKEAPMTARPRAGEIGGNSG